MDLTEPSQPSPGRQIGEQAGTLATQKDHRCSAQVGEVT